MLKEAAIGALALFWGGLVYWLMKFSFGFYIYHLLALLVGGMFIYFGRQVLMSKKGKKWVHYSIIVIGIAMSFIHLTKLILGVCV